MASAFLFRYLCIINHVCRISNYGTYYSRIGNMLWFEFTKYHTTTYFPIICPKAFSFKKHKYIYLLFVEIRRNDSTKIVYEWMTPLYILLRVFNEGKSIILIYPIFLTSTSWKLFCCTSCNISIIITFINTPPKYW